MANPRGPAFPIVLRTWINTGLPLPLGEEAEEVVYILRPPTRFRRVEPSSQTAINSQGWGWQNPLTTVLKDQDQFFGLAGNPTFDFPNPRGPNAIYPVSLRTWIDPLKINLIGQDAFFGLAGNPTFDFPNPRGKQPPPLTWTDRINLPLTTAPVDPRVQHDWPVPRGYQHPLSLRTHIDTTRVYSPAMPVGRQTDWPNPRGYAPRQWFVGLGFGGGLPIAPVTGGAIFLNRPQITHADLTSVNLAYAKLTREMLVQSDTDTEQLRGSR